MKGATTIIMFKKNLTAVRYAKILETGLILFIGSKFPDNTNSNRTMILSTEVITSNSF